MLTIHTVAPDAPLYRDVQGFALTAEQLQRQPPDELLIALEGETVRARCGLWFQPGFVGHYYADALAAGRALLDAACARLAAAGCPRALGPVDGSTWQRYRLVTWRGAEPPFFLEPDNPDDWPGHFVAAGFTPLAEYHSALAEGLDVRDPRAAAAAHALEWQGIRVRAFNADDFEGELCRIHEVALTAFANNLLYTPLPRADFLAQYVPLRPYLRPELFLLAERDRQLVGFLFGLPDVLRQPLDTALIKTLAVHPDYQGSGLGGYLMDRFHQTAHEHGYRRVIHALMHAGRAIGRISDRSARIIRRYTLYARPLGAR